MSYQEKINSSFLFTLGIIIASFVVLQSLIFLVRAYKQGLKMGMDKEKLNSAIKSSAIFTILPSIPIVIALFTLIPSLGKPISWIRLSVVGAVTYELPVAETAAKAMGMTGLTDPNFTMDIFAGMVLTMSIGIIWGLLFCILNGVKIVQKKMDKMQNTDRTWGEMLVTALFMGLIASFFGSIVAPPIVGLVKGTVPAYTGITSILVLVSSAIIMLMFTLLTEKVKKLKWLESFALPVSMVIAMCLAIVYYKMLGGTI